MSLYHHLMGISGGGEPVLVLRVKNVAEVVAKQGGGLAAAANAVLPVLVRDKVYSTIQEQLLVEFKKQGVDAEVTLASVPPVGLPLSGKRDFLTGVVVGGVTIVGGWALWKYLLSKMLFPLFLGR